jgi:hypothetical protein
MEHPLKILAQHWDLTAAQYLHLRLLCSLLLGPLLGILYLVFFDLRRRSGAAPSPKLPMRISRNGQLLA